MRHLSGFILLLFSFVISVHAQSWIDITDNFVVNPRFDGNDITTGWLGTAFGAANPKENAEHYQKNFNTYQVITGMTPGKYRVSLNAFYRCGSADNDYSTYTDDNATDYQYAKLYATSTVDDQSVGIALASSAAIQDNLGGATSTVGGKNQTLFIPNNMEAAYYWFNAGYYQNAVEVEVGSDGQLTIGVKKDVTVGGDWTCLDNWKLEYWGIRTYVSDITFTDQEIEIQLGEGRKLTPDIQPSNATNKKLSWSSSDTNIVTVDEQGNILGVGRGKATITATATDGSNVSASCTINVLFNGATAESAVVNELMAANVDMFLDPSWNYGSWVEFYNPTDKNVSIAHYWISDDPANLKKCRIPTSIGNIPAHGFRTIWFDHAETAKDVGEQWENTQLDMKLDCEGGVFYLSDEEGNMILQHNYPQAVMRTSYARTTDGGDEWRLTATPTPSASNATSIFSSMQLEDPVVDTDGCLFDGTMEVRVTFPVNTTLRYTTDGTLPTLENGTTSVDGRFDIRETTTLKLRLFQDGYLPSNDVTRSYIQRDKDYYLPIVSIVTDPANLYDDQIGVYVTGTNGKTANMDYTKRNFNMEWDRPVNFEYILPEPNSEGESYFNQGVDFCISGGWSRKYEPRSFKLKAAKVYNLQNTLNFAFFQDKPFNRNKTLLLRNGGNDEYNQTRIKDAAIQSIARESEFPLNLQSYHPTHVFFNGRYMGMLNMREPSNKHYAYANYGIDTDEVDAFEMSVDSGYVQKDGTKEAFNEWYTLAENAKDALAYEQILQRVDIDDYINYMAFKFFLNDWDWPHNNAKGFRSRKDGKFHFVVFDLDNTVDRTGNNIFYDFANKKQNTFYSRPEYGGTSLTLEVELVTTFLNMLQNEDFRRRFIDTYCIVGGTVFGDQERIGNIVNSIATNIETALSWEGHTPWGTGRSFAGGIINALTGDFTKTMINVLKSFTGCWTYDGVYYDGFGLAETEPQAVKLSSTAPNGTIAINGINVPQGRFDGYLFAPVTLSAQAPAGYRFSGWMQQNATEVTKTVFGTDTKWYYSEGTSLDNTGWQGTNYNASAWAQGTAPFGFGNAGKPMANATTKLTKGYPTYYLRKEFTLDKAPSSSDTYVMDYNIDDGVIFYINGQESEIYHMWSGATYDQTCQSTGNNWYEGDTPHAGSFVIPNNMLRKGTNVIAVEVHNCNMTSSDIWFDASLSVRSPLDSENSIISTEQEYQLPTTGEYDLVAVYDKMTDAELAEGNITPVRINEISAGNTVNTNEYYKKDDWVELYNTTDEDIDLEGMYITDDKSLPHKCRISSNGTQTSTIIPAHGYKIIWCDKRNTESQLHVNFKLSNTDGSFIRIEAADGTWADSIWYCAHLGTESVGRYPDGCNDIFVMDKTTIGARNLLGSYSEKWEYTVPEDTTESGVGIITNTTMMKLRYTDESLVLTGDGIAEITIYTPSGATVLHHTVSLSSGRAAISVASLPKGIYEARAINRNGKEVVLKFIKR